MEGSCGEVGNWRGGNPGNSGWSRMGEGVRADVIRFSNVFRWQIDYLNAPTWLSECLTQTNVTDLIVCKPSQKR